MHSKVADFIRRTSPGGVHRGCLGAMTQGRLRL